MTLCGFLPYGVCMLCVLTPSSSSWLCATSLLGYTWMWAIIQRERERERESRMSVAAELPSGTKLLWMRSLICLSFDTDPSQSQSVSLSCSDCASEVCSSSLPPSFFFFLYITHKHTPVFAKGERARAGNRLLERRLKRSASCSFLFCFFFFFFWRLSAYSG